MLTNQDIEKLKSVFATKEDFGIFATKDDFKYLKIKINGIDSKLLKLREEIKSIG